MKCPRCLTGFLKVTHTRDGGPGYLTQRRKCVACHTVYTSINTIVHEAPKVGQGAHMLAKRKKEQGNGSA